MSLVPCPSYSRRRDRNNCVHWRSLYKGMGGYKGRSEPYTFEDQATLVWNAVKEDFRAKCQRRPCNLVHWISSTREVTTTLTPKHGQQSPQNKTKKRKVSQPSFSATRETERTTVLKKRHGLIDMPGHVAPCQKRSDDGTHPSGIHSSVFAH